MLYCSNGGKYVESMTTLEELELNSYDDILQTLNVHKLYVCG